MYLEYLVTTNFPAVCTPLFKAAACFPYCMAARLSGSGADGLVLYNASNWHKRVPLMKRDHIVNTPVVANAVQAVASKLAQHMPNGTMYSTDEFPKAETIVHTDVVAGASVIASKWDANTMGCVQSNVAHSILTAESHPAYDTSSAQQKRIFRSILMKLQPFAYAGDVTLTAVDSGTGKFYVSVDRLFGNEVNEYTMLSVQARFLC